jgi:hypothetical protein
MRQINLFVGVVFALTLAGCQMTDVVSLSAAGGPAVLFRQTYQPGDRLVVNVIGSIEARVVKGAGIKEVGSASEGEPLKPTEVSGLCLKEADGVRVTLLSGDAHAVYTMPAGPAAVHITVTALKTPITSPPVLNEAVKTDYVFVVQQSDPPAR